MNPILELLMKMTQAENKKTIEMVEVAPDVWAKKENKKDA